MAAYIFIWGDGMGLIGPPDFLVKAVWVLLTILLLLLIYYLINIGNRFISDRNRIEISNKNILITLIFLVGIYILIKTFNKYSFLSDMLYTIVISIIIAYALNPIINYLERKNINRLKGVLIVYLSIVAIIIILAVSVIPKSGQEIKRLVNNLPFYFQQLSNIMDGIYSRYNLVLGGLPPMFQGVEAVVMENIVKLENIIADSLKNFVSGILNVASKVVSIVLTPILTLYFLVDKDYFKEKITRLIPERHRRDTLYLASTINTSLNQFIRGRLLMSLYIAIATTILLLIMGIDFAVGIGFITGLFDIVPYIGPLLGYLPAVFFASISKPIKAVWVSVFFVLIQWVENNVLAPKIIGENMGMHPMLILLSIIIGGGIFGVFGMILSVPIVAITRIVYIFFMEKKRR